MNKLTMYYILNGKIEKDEIGGVVFQEEIDRRASERFYGEDRIAWLKIEDMFLTEQEARRQLKKELKEELQNHHANMKKLKEQLKNI